ncbi:MAG: type 1 glutamine amidotransferase [Geobacteraceae bacterium]|nr:type 1 glutamine amidotransferase [Geobacteraceae bacterium]
MRVLILSADNFEDSELLVPYYRFLEEGFQVEIASMRMGIITGKHGYEVEVDKIIDEVNADDYDLLLLPGGKAPAELRKQPAALEIARHFFAGNRPVAAICHGPQILISAGLLKGKRVTCYKLVATEMKESGADYQDRELVVDGNLITSRQPSDIPVFMREIMKMTHS